MNPSTPWMTWVVIEDHSMSSGRNREVFDPADDCVSSDRPFDKSPMHRAFDYARYRLREVRMECNHMASGTITVFCQSYPETRQVFYCSEDIHSPHNR